MALSLRSKTQVYSSSSPTSVSINKPTGTAEGDLMLIFIGEQGSDLGPSAIKVPSGWKPVVTSQHIGETDTENATAFPSHQVYMKTAGSSEPSSYTFALINDPNQPEQTFCMCSFYNTTSTSGYWEMTDSGVNKILSGTALTTNTLSGGGLYITSFMSTATTTVSSTNSPGTSASFQNSDVSMAIYEGESSTLTNSTTLTFAATGLIFCCSLMFKYRAGSIPSAPTNILQRAKTSANSGIIFGTTGTMTLNKPTGTVSGDLMVMCASFGYIFTAPTITWPTGWTVVYDFNNLPSGFNSNFPFLTAVIYKVAGSSEPSSYSVTINSQNGYAWSLASLSSWYNSDGVGGWNLIRKNTTSSVLSTEYYDDPTFGDLVFLNYARSLGFGGKGLWITPVYALAALDQSSTGLLSISSSEDVDGNSVTVLQSGLATAGIYPTNFTVFAQVDSFDFNNIVIQYNTAGDGAEEEDIVSQAITPLMFESTVTPGPTTYVSKIKVGGAYKNITDGWVAVDSTSSGSPDVWKKITSGNISVEDNTGDDVWVEIFK